MVELEERIAEQQPEHFQMLKSRLLEDATSEELVKWVDNPAMFLSKVRDCLEGAGHFRTTTKYESSDVQNSSDDMMITVNETDGLRVTDEEMAATNRLPDKEE